MARLKGSISLSNSLEPNVAHALDARTVSETKADLTVDGSFDYPYVGMIVSVQDEGKAYILKAFPTTDADNWAEVGSDIDTAAIQDEINKRPEAYIETTTVVVAENDDVALVEGQTVTIVSSDGTKEYSGVVDATGKAIITVEGATVTVEYDSGNNALVVSNPENADIDTTEIKITTETVHKIDSRLLPKGQAVDTQDYLQASLTVKEAQGKYKVGDIIPKDTDLETIIKNMLTKTNEPTLRAPSASMSATGSKLLEVGDTLNTTMTVTFDRGGISPAYGTSGFRAGEATAYSLNGGGEQAENTFSVTVTESNTSFTATVKHAAGEQPLNDEGGVFGEALEAGSVQTNTITYEFVPALYSNASNIMTIAKEALVSRSVGSKIFNFPASTVANPEIADIPAAWTITAIEVENELSARYEDCAGEFTITDVVHPDASGTDVAYKRLTDSRGYASGPRKIKVKWS